MSSFGQLAENVGVICVLTANVPVVYIEKNSINHEENKAWAERFGANVLHFNCKLPNPDKRFKTWGKLLEPFLNGLRFDTSSWVQVDWLESKLAASQP